MSIEVIGGINGVPTIKEQDVILALFRIYFKNNKEINYNEDMKIDYTLKELYEELGYIKLSEKEKNNLEKSLKILNEVTMYGKYVKRNKEKLIPVTTKDYQFVKFSKIFIGLMKSLGYI